MSTTKRIKMAQISPNSRIKELRQSLGLSQQAFADALGVSRSYVKDIEIGRSDPSFNFLRTLTGVYNANLNWIVEGIGSVYNEAQLTVRDSDNKLYGVFEQLTVEQQQMVFSITQEMVKMNSIQQEVKQLSDEISSIKGFPVPKR